jgi:hypothetical protein
MGEGVGWFRVDLSKLVLAVVDGRGREVTHLDLSPLSVVNYHYPGLNSYYITAAFQVSRLV